MKNTSYKVFDWIRARLPEDAPTFFLQDFPEAGRTFVRNYGDGDYRYFEYSGDVEYPNPYDMILSGLDITRLDTCFDFDFSQKEFKDFKATCDKIMKIRRTKTIKSDSGITCYYEGVKGLKVRIYQKGLQMGLGTRHVRLEFEMHNPFLRDKLSLSKDFSEVQKDLLRRYTTLGDKLPKLVKNNPYDAVPQSYEERFETIYSELKNKKAEKLFLDFLSKKLDKEVRC